MRVTLLPELFDPPVQHTLLVTLLGYPLEERHRVELDVTHPVVNAWFAVQAPELRQEIELALAWSVQEEVLEPSHTAVHIVRAAPSDYLANPARVCLDDARRFLDSPFVVLLEDADSDRAFLDRMMTSEERRFLTQRIQAGFVRVDHGGGVEAMTRRIVRESEAPETHHKRWVLFDSDAMRPGSPSAASEALRGACRDVAHHQLRRRYVESYLPHGALHSWAIGARPRDRRERLPRFRAFVAMTDDQRHYYNMKRGFDGDAERTDATAGDLYANISQPDRTALAVGFGRNISELFAGNLVTEADLRRDTGWAELRPALAELLARVR